MPLNRLGPDKPPLIAVETASGIDTRATHWLIDCENILCGDDIAFLASLAAVSGSAIELFGNDGAVAVWSKGLAASGVSPVRTERHRFVMDDHRSDAADVMIIVRATEIVVSGDAVVVVSRDHIFEAALERLRAVGGNARIVPPALVSAGRDLASHRKVVTRAAAAAVGLRPRPRLDRARVRRRRRRAVRDSRRWDAVG